MITGTGLFRRIKSAIPTRLWHNRLLGIRTIPDFYAMLVSKKDGQLCFKSLKNYETRNQSTAKLIQQADNLYNFKDFDWIIINTDDQDVGNSYHGLKVFSYSTSSNNYEHVCPDFLMDCWPQVQIDDYETELQKLSDLGGTPATRNVLGWRGAMTHPNRYHLLKFTDKSKYDIEEIQWDRSNPQKLTCVNYVSMSDSVRNWRYLIDVEARGWSARVKLLLFSKRVLFLQEERPYREWYYPRMKPWKHYVPVKRDLSNLEENLKVIKADTTLEDKIRFGAHEFAMSNLRREQALKRWKELLEKL